MAYRISVTNPYVSVYQDMRQFKLPLEVVIEILKHLSPKDLRACKLPSIEWNQCLAHESIQQSLFSRYFPLNASPPETKHFLKTHRNRDILSLNFKNKIYSVHVLERNKADQGDVESLAVGEGKLAVGDSLGRVEIWDSANQECWRGPAHDFFVSCLAIKEGKVFAGFSEGMIEIFYPNTDASIECLELKRRKIRSLTYADGKLIAGVHDKVIKIIDLHANTTTTIHGDMSWCSSSVLADGKCFSCHSGGSIKAIDTGSLNYTTVFTGHKTPVFSLIIIDGKLISGDSGGMIKVWDLNTGEWIGNLEGHTGRVTSLVAAEGMLISGSLDKKIKIWDLSAGACVASLEDRDEGVKALVYTNGKLFVNKQRSVEILDFTKASDT